MSQTRITELTAEQKALIPIICDEWIKIALDTSPTDKEKVVEAIDLAYSCLGLKPPQKILFFNNPLDAVKWMVNNKDKLDKVLSKNEIWGKFKTTINDFAVERSIEITIENSLFSKLRQVKGIVIDILVSILSIIVNEEGFETERDFLELNFHWNYNGIFELGDQAFYAYLQALGVDCSKVKGMWETAKHCGMWCAYKDIAIVTPKPSVIALDNENRLHAEGKPSVVYEGFHIYAYHGVRLPEKYGKIHPSKWQPKWLLEEDNAELRRVLIQGIGYDRICQELNAVELDAWQNYFLLGIEENVDVEPIYLLKMICPSTGYIHMLRVPPDVNSAREAIRWVNGGIDPEEFAVQT